MPADQNQVRDTVAVELNGAAVDGQLPPIPERPSDKAAKAKWADYCVALGAAREPLDDLTRGDLIDLAGRLGG